MSNTDVQTGYTLDGVFAVEQHFETREPDLSDEEGDTTISWDWRINSETGFAVWLSLGIEGPAQNPANVRVGYVAVFKRSGAEPTLDLKNFVVFSASALLIPYIRQSISWLTAAGPFEQVDFAPVNVKALLDFVDFERSTGFLQMQESRELAAAYGFEEEIHGSKPDSDHAAASEEAE